MQTEPFAILHKVLPSDSEAISFVTACYTYMECPPQLRRHCRLQSKETYVGWQKNFERLPHGILEKWPNEVSYKYMLKIVLSSFVLVLSVSTSRPTYLRGPSR